MPKKNAMLVSERAPLGIASGDEFLVFTSASSRTVAVLYRRKDGHYGLIEPEGR